MRAPLPCLQIESTQEWKGRTIMSKFTREQLIDAGSTRRKWLIGAVAGGVGLSVGRRAIAAQRNNNWVLLINQTEHTVTFQIWVADQRQRDVKIGPNPQSEGWGKGVSTSASRLVYMDTSKKTRFELDGFNNYVYADGEDKLPLFVIAVTGREKLTMGPVEFPSLVGR